MKRWNTDTFEYKWIYIRNEALILGVILWGEGLGFRVLVHPLVHKVGEKNVPYVGSSAINCRSARDARPPTSLPNPNPNPNPKP